MIKRVLAWDDKPEEYFDSLKRHLTDKGISVEITREPATFDERFKREDWDLVITDILLEDSPAIGEEEPVGKKIAQKAAETHPVFVLTRLQETRRIAALDLPRDVVVKTKVTPPSFVAGEIQRDLRQRGLLPEPGRVFLVGGESDESREAGRRLQSFLIEQCRLDHIMTGTEDLDDGDLRRLQRKMRDCAAILAICGPDTDGADGQMSPGAQTLMQIGIAAGLPNGLPRLTLLQKWGDTREERAVLPRSLSKVETLRFKKSIEEIYPVLVKRLLKLQVDIYAPPL